MLLARWRQPLVLALAMAVLGGTVTTSLWYQASQDSSAELHDLMVHDARDFKTSIESQLTRHQLVLGSFVGFFGASDQVTRDDFGTFYRAVVKDHRQYSFVGVNYIESVSADQLAAHIAQVRRSGQAAYTIHPPGARPLYAPIVYIEPFSGANLLALGYDPLSLAPARQALLRARDTGQVAITGKLTLKQDATRSAPGFSMYVPIYRKGASIDTVAQRQGALEGWIGGPCRASVLVPATLPGKRADLKLSIYASAQPTPEMLMASSHPNAAAAQQPPALLQHAETLAFGGQTWSLHVQALPGYGPEAVVQRPHLIAGGGALLSALAAVATLLLGLFLGRRRQVAQQREELAQARGREAARHESERVLRDSEFAARLALDRANTLAKQLERSQADLEQQVQQRTAELQQSVTVAHNALSALDQQKAALADSVSLLNATLESTAYGMLVVDLQGTIVRWNQRFVDLWHIPAALLQSQVDGEVLTHVAQQLARPQAFLDHVEQLTADANRSSSDVVELADGRVFKRISLPQRLGEQVLGRVWSFDDITELKRIEQAALAASRAKSAFLANMSHEIRTPMNGVVGMVDILQQTILSPEQQRMLRTISQSSLALLGILNDILDYSKIEAGKLQVECVPTQLTEVVQDVLQLLTPTAAAKSVALAVTQDPALPQWLLLDPARLRQVLLNLLGNAIKFSANGTRAAQVQLRTALLPAMQTPERLQLCVSDNGIGISEAVQARLFQPFMQADASTSRQFGGTGLGLSISQRLVELMGGTLAVSSRLGEGATFTVTLPLQVAQAPVAPAAAERRKRHRRVPAAPLADDASRLVLLAEDNETNRDVLREQLQLLGYQAELAHDGVQALQMWQSGRYALLLTDCHMPHMDGFALTQAIRQAEPAGTHAPIIAVTANAMQGEAERCLACGMDDYLPKPLRMTDLQQMMARWLPLPQAPDSMPAALEANESVRSSIDSENVADGALPIWVSGTLSTMVGDNPGMHTRLLRKFLVNAHQQVAQIQADAKTPALDAIAGVAHTLKSAARTVGALALGELCQQIETSGRAGDRAACLSRVAKLAEALAQAEHCIGRALPIDAKAEETTASQTNGPRGV